MRAGVILAVLIVVCSPAIAQQSTSYHVTDHVINEGGAPRQGAAPASASYNVTPGSLGGGISGLGMHSASFHVDAGFSSAYPAPGEVSGLHFSDLTTLRWNPQSCAGVYDVYRDLLTQIGGGGYGDCWRPNLTQALTSDGARPAAGSGYFYLVTVENRLGQEGAKGTDSAGSTRHGSACP